MAKKKVYSAAFKSKVAIEALKEQSTLAELATKYEISQMTISRWRKELEDGSESVFSSKLPETKKHERKIERLHAKIGELEMKVDFCKRASEKLGIPVPEDY